MKKTIAFILVLVLCCTASIGLTVAYLTDRDSAANIFTVGDVSIELSEDFEQGATLIPGVDIVKAPTITNTGLNDAWVWATVAIPAALDDDDASQNVIHFNYDNDSVNTAHWTWTDAEGKWMVDTITIDDVEYNRYVVLYQTALQPGQTTAYPFMTKVYLDTNIDIDPEGNWYHVENGNVTGPFWNSNTNGNPIIYVNAYAIQTESFATVQEGYAAYIAQWGKLNGSYATTKIPGMRSGVVDLTDDLILLDEPFFHEYQTLEPYTINGNGRTVTMVASSEQTFDWTENYTIPLMANVFSSGEGALVTVNDLTMTGTMQSVMAGNYEGTNQGRHNTVFNNVNIVNPQVVSLSAGISPALTVYGKLEMNNCNVYGATLSPLDTDPKWPVYDMAVVNESVTTVNGGKIGSIYTWAKAKLVLNDADVDSITVNGNMNTNAAYGIVIGAGTTVDTIDLSAITNKDRVNITIEDGATVGKIVANGVEYASIEAWKNA